MKGETCSCAHDVVMPSLPQSNQQLSVTWGVGKGSREQGDSDDKCISMYMHSLSFYLYKGDVGKLLLSSEHPGKSPATPQESTRSTG